MKKKFLYLLLLIPLFGGCKSIPKQEKVTIPFEIDKTYGEHFLINIEIGGKNFDFFMDTGTDTLVGKDSVFDALYGEEKNTELLGYYLNNLDSFYKTDVEKLSFLKVKENFYEKKSLILKKYYSDSLTSYNLEQIDARSGEKVESTTKVWFKWFELNFIGLYFFKNLKNIVFNCQDNVIELNSTRKLPKKNCCKMRKINLPDSYTYEALIEIDGKKEWAMIDSGSPFMLEKVVNKGDEFENRELKKMHTVTVGKRMYPDLVFMNVNAPDLFFVSSESKELCSETNIIGYPLFKNHIVTMDFEHNLFCVE